MTDYDHRPRGGRGGYQNNRKRRYRDDEDLDRRPPRRRYEEPLSSRLRKQLLSIAESSHKRVEDEIASIGATLAEHADDASLSSGFFELALQVVLEQPFKIPFVAAALVWANAGQAALGAEILERATQRLDGSVRVGAWREVKLLLRLLAGCQGMLEGDGIWSVLQDLLTKAVELQTGDNEETLGPELVKIVLLTIPYIVASSAADSSAMAASMLENTDIIASEPHVLQALVDPFAEGREDASTPQGTLALLQHQLQNESENGWQLACLPRPWKVGDEAQMKALDVATKHVLPTINVPDTIYAGQTLLFPQVHFSVYSNQEVETVPSTANIASTLVRDAIVDTINLLDFNRNATSRFLIDVDCYFAPGTFVKRATPFDRLRDIEAGKSTWKPEDVAVDAVFSQLFQLPAPEQKLVYYHSVLIESCKIAPAAIAPSLGRAIRFLYRNVETMDLELSYRFMDWFAHHLSNFGFTWKWTEWVDDVHLADYDPRKSFIKGALDKEIRLSFAQRIKGTLPPPYQTLISAEKEKDSPDFKFQDPTTPFASTALEIHGALRRKAPASEMEPLLATIQSAAQTEHSHSAPHLPAIDAFVTSLCHIGSKSLSHMLSCIERNKDQLLAFAGSGNDAVKQIIDSVSAYWQHHPGTSVNIIGKLLNYLIVTPQSVIEWCIGDNSTSLAQMWCYELVAETVGKVSTRTRQVINASTDGEDETMDAQHNTAIELAKTARKDLAALLEDILSSWASGSKDQAMQSGDGSSEAEAATRVWARRWLRSFRREAAVQEVWGERSAERVAIQRVQTAVSTELAEKDRARTEKKRLQQEEQAERKRQEQQEQRNAGGIDEAIDHSADLVDTDVVNFDEAV